MKYHIKISWIIFHFSYKYNLEIFFKITKIAIIMLQSDLKISLLLLEEFCSKSEFNLTYQSLLLGHTVYLLLNAILLSPEQS